MNSESKNLLCDFEFTNNNTVVRFLKYKDFEFVLNMIVCGTGPVGDNGYLILWEKDILEKRNDDYMVSEFLDDVFLIGSDGGENAFGVNIKKQFIVVPFFDMRNENICVLANTFDGFIKQVSECDY